MGIKLSLGTLRYTEEEEVQKQQDLI